MPRIGGATVPGSHARNRDTEWHLQKDRQVPGTEELVSVQEAPVQDEDRPGSRVLLGRFHRQVGGQVVRGRPVATVAARTERLQNPLVQSAQVVAVEPEASGEVRPRR